MDITDGLVTDEMNFLEVATGLEFFFLKNSSKFQSLQFTIRGQNSKMPSCKHCKSYITDNEAQKMLDREREYDVEAKVIMEKSRGEVSNGAKHN